MRRRLIVLAFGVLLLVVACPVGLRLGAASISWHDVAHALFDYRGSYTDVVVRDFRVPEVLIAIEVGAALAVAGALMQGLTRNRLADPGILGINAGASLFVVLGIVLIGVSAPIDFVWFAFPGAVLGVGMGSLVAIVGRGRSTPLKLTLGGVITGTILGTATQIVVMLNPLLSGEQVYWATGDVNGKTMSVLYATLPMVAVGLLIAMPLGRALNGMSMGEDIARSLGQRVAATRAAVILATTLLAGGAVAAVGPFAFVGFAVPHIVRARVGNDYRWILPLCAVYGAALVVVAEIVGRVIITPNVMPTGEVIAIGGGVMFLVSVCRRGGVAPL